KQQIAEQLRSYRVKRIDGEGSLELQLAVRARPAKVDKRISVEAEAPDSDGVAVHFLLHVVGGFCLEVSGWGLWCAAARAADGGGEAAGAGAEAGERLVLEGARELPRRKLPALSRAVAAGSFQTVTISALREAARD